MRTSEKKIKKHIIPFIIISLIVAFVCTMLYTRVCEWFYIKEMEQRAQKYINSLHNYYNENGFMPSDYHIDDESIVYLKESDSSFAVYFLLGFDETVTYHSNKKRWTIE